MRFCPTYQWRLGTVFVDLIDPRRTKTASLRVETANKRETFQPASSVNTVEVVWFTIGQNSADVVLGEHGAPPREASGVRGRIALLHERRVEPSFS
jgi:hypothetical protein